MIIVLVRPETTRGCAHNVDGLRHSAHVNGCAVITIILIHFIMTRGCAADNSLRTLGTIVCANCALHNSSESLQMTRECAVDDSSF